ncbi:hypothetical protein HMPREF1550_01606 [Actinomyces sp. oral taxon 877 str. F0543]|nr:hypothetical protein HMPREF1550_01606 [Actinomyces sp. oral taxon 877 str. F0543]
MVPEEGGWGVRSCPQRPVRWEQGGRCWSRGQACSNHIARQDKNFLQLLRDNPDALDTELNPLPTTNGTTP